jgi:malonate decarboxylase beta subunit
MKDVVLHLPGGCVSHWRNHSIDDAIADTLVEDDAVAIAEAVRDAFRRGLPKQHRSEQVKLFLERLAAIDPSQPLDGKALRALWGKGETA